MDFFIDEEEVTQNPSLQTSAKTPSTSEKNHSKPPISSSTVLDVASSMNAIKLLITPE